VEIHRVGYSDKPALSYLPTLVLDSNGPAAKLLADQLSHHGFTADVATSCSAAQAAFRSRYYGSAVIVADLSLLTDLQCISNLRTQSPRTWIIVISSDAPPDAQERILRHGADAVLTCPFSMRELIARLLTCSLRSRPCR
jgi:DNA-binding response OmpR family regulator